MVKVTLPIFFDARNHISGMAEAKSRLILCAGGIYQVLDFA